MVVLYAFGSQMKNNTNLKKEKDYNTDLKLLWIHMVPKTSIIVSWIQ